MIEVVTHSRYDAAKNLCWLNVTAKHWLFQKPFFFDDDNKEKINYFEWNRLIGIED